MNISLHGIWKADIGDGRIYEMRLPGTLDENQIGYRDTGANQWHPDAALGNENESFHTDVIATRFTRRYTYEGEARLTRVVDGALWEEVYAEIARGKRVFLEAERARVLRLWVDGEEVPDFIPPSISTHHIFEVTGRIRKGSELLLISDNSYPGLPHDAIVYSSAATDETQTNWNGVLGSLCLRTEQPVFLGEPLVYPKGDSVTVKIKLYANGPYQGAVRVHCDALEEDVTVEAGTQNPEESKVRAQGNAVGDSEGMAAEVRIQGLESAVGGETAGCGAVEVVLEGLPLKRDIRRWDLEEGNLYELSASLMGGETKTVRFGIRDFGDDGRGKLAVNGRTIFLRGEANCAEFPETGHPPMTVEEWLDILERYRSYGVNCMRFHSHCPPEAAFAAADQLGILMQPELSHWNPRDAFSSEESYHYYKTELVQILEMLANHPSFVMLTFGNELQAEEKGRERMRELLALAREKDGTRLYANASNAHYGAIGCDEASDFYTSHQIYDRDLRATSANMQGYLNHRYPSAMSNYDDEMTYLREKYAKPVFTFEVGQYEVLPDFAELEAFKGISDPANLRLIQERVAARGLSGVWEKYVEATGELSRIGYREEVEAVLRTKALSGISLLGLQDFPGQGTALVGMMNSHLQPKPYEFARPEHFRGFFRDQLPLVLLPKYTWETGETLSAEIKFANYGKTEIGGTVECALYSQSRSEKGASWEENASDVLWQTSLPRVICPQGELSGIGTLEIPLDSLGLEEPARLNLEVRIDKWTNRYPIWIYPPITPVCPEDVYEAVRLDEKAKSILAAGGKVYLTPPSVKEALPPSIQAQFSTDFWSVGTFAGQQGGMGQLIDAKHPIFDRFPTEFHTNWQWWPMATQRAVILPGPYAAIITEMDSYAFLRPMAQLLECRCGNGKLLFSSMGLQNLQRYPEARALLRAIYDYMGSKRFEPRQEIETSFFELQ